MFKRREIIRQQLFKNNRTITLADVESFIPAWTEFVSTLEHCRTTLYPSVFYGAGFPDDNKEKMTNNGHIGKMKRF